MPSVLAITPARQRPGHHRPANAYFPCPVTQCDITVKVCLRRNDGVKVPLRGVRVRLTATGGPFSLTTDAGGVARFIGYVPAQGRQSVSVRVRLVGADANDYAWYDWSSGKLKAAPPYPADDTVAQFVRANRQELFYFEAAQQTSMLVVELNRADGRPLPARVPIDITGPGGALPQANTLAKETHYRGIRVTQLEAQRKWLNQREGTRYRGDRLELAVNQVGAHTITLANAPLLLNQQAQPGEVWRLNPPGNAAIAVDVPAGGEARVVYTLTRYTHVQFISFLTRVGTVGNANLVEDLKIRCALYRKAVEQAQNVDQGDHVLKVFMAPEFYFQGREGKYGLDLITGVDKGRNKRPGILASLRSFFRRADYKDWLFVVGTAIGSLEHAAPPQPFRLRITAVNALANQITVDKNPRVPGSDPSACGYVLHIPPYEWKILQRTNPPRTVTAAASQPNGSYLLTLGSVAGLAVGACELQPPGQQGFHILQIVAKQGPPHNTLTVAAGRDKTSCCQDVAPLWRAVQAGAGELIVKAVRSANVPGAFDLHMAATTAPFAVNQPVYLFEPAGRTEVFNVALCAKGGPDPQNPGNIDQPPVNRSGSLRELVVVKEHVSSIDYDAPVTPRNWGDRTGAGRLVTFGGQLGTVMPTQGSWDTLGGIDSIPATTGQSEVQGSGLGGGSVFGVDGVTFGMEVCLDHLMGKLDRFYSPGGGVKDGDPYPQILLIPSCGMNIGSGIIHAADDGYIFNVDGGCYLYAVLRKNNGHYSCDKHITEDHLAAGECTQLPRDHAAHAYCPMPHNQKAVHLPKSCWCFAPHSVGAPGQCGCGQQLVAENGGEAFRCPSWWHANGTHAAAGACWCGQNHGVAAGQCLCGKALVAGRYHLCPMPHNLGGMHFEARCWCGVAHSAGLPGACPCGQALVRNVATGLYGCPRAHTDSGIHDGGLCWCGQNHVAPAAPGTCGCGMTLETATYHTCTRPHAQVELHGAGNCGGPCGQNHTALAPGQCTVCTRPLVAGQVFACPGFSEQIQKHDRGASCQTCGGAHPGGAPGPCGTCGETLVAGNYHYCVVHSLQQTHPEGPCGCTANHTALAPGACPVCTETLVRAPFGWCAAHGRQAGPACGLCPTPLADVVYYYCPRPHNLVPAQVSDAPGNCATCVVPRLPAPFFSCPGLHNQANVAEAGGNCGTCNQARRPTDYYHCLDRHNQRQPLAAGGNCATCLQATVASPYFYCRGTHTLLSRQAAAPAAPCACAANLVAVDYFHCSGKHAHQDNQSQVTNRFSGLHSARACWCGNPHTLALPGACDCGQALVVVPADGSFACPREHTRNGLHPKGACWCGTNHTALVPNCDCGSAMSEKKYRVCGNPHAHGWVHEAGTCAGACTQAHTHLAPGNCTVCAGALTRRRVYACPGAREQKELHDRGASCQLCAQNHPLLAPGPCATCGLTLVAGQYFYCPTHDVRNFHLDGPCGCGGNHAALAPGACPQCSETLLPLYVCVTHGRQAGPNCGSCPAVPVLHFYCRRLHSLGNIHDVGGNCPGCAKALLPAPFYACPGHHNRLHPRDAGGNCARCNTPLDPVDTYVCTALHNRDAFQPSGDRCWLCDRPLVDLKVFQCDNAHAFDSGTCGACSGTTRLVWAYDNGTKPIGKSIAPAWGPHNVSPAGLRDSAGPVTWGRYFKQDWGRVSVYPVQPLPPGKVMP